jgi:hypothetical protein
MTPNFASRGALSALGRALGACGVASALALGGCSGAIDNMGKPRGSDPSSPSEPGKGTGGGNSNTGGGNNTGGGSNSGGGMPGPGPTPVATPGLSVGVSPLRRLTSQQYLNTVRDLLKLDAAAVLGPGSLPNDNSIVERFASNADGAVTSSGVDQYADAAATLAAKAITNLGGLVPCSPAAGNAECASTFIAGFGRRAFRRPLTQVEVDRYKRAYTAGGDFSNGIRLVVQAMLQSPKFLYHVEPVPADAAGKILALDSWSMASRLSYFFLNTMPDDELFAAADKNELGNAEQVGRAASRLMADARFQETTRYFHDQWLELGEVRGADKDATLFPTWNDEVKGLLAEQTYKFVENAFASSGGGGKLAALMTSTTTFMKGPLYELYGLPKGAGADWAKVELNDQQRGGILTHAGFMAGLAHEDRTSFILRGKVVREALLCTPVPPPPPGLNASETDIPATATARERSEKHRTEASCAACHQLFDPVGFAFETYDAVGRFRDKDGSGKAIDSVLDFNEKTGLDGHYANALEFVKKLGDSDELGACVTKQWMRFALGREVEDGAMGADQPSLDAGKKALKEGGKITDLLAALARSDAFRHQKVLP